MGYGYRDPLDRLRLWVGGAIITGLVVVALGSCVGCHVETSNGDRVGVVTKFSRKGVAIKTWEGEAILGSADVPGVGTTWTFTVDSSGPVSAVETAMREGKKVRLHYCEFLAGGKINGDTDYRVVSVEPIVK